MADKKEYVKYIRLPSDDGKRHRCVIRASSEKELEEKYRAKLMELAKNDYRFSATSTVGNFFPRFMMFYVPPNLREGARHDKEARLRRYLIDPYGGMELSTVSPMLLQKILNDNTGRSKSFLSKLKLEMTAFFSAAEEEGLIQRNPCKRLFLPACTDKARRALTEEERTAFLAAAEQQKHGLIFLIMYYCGLRPGEARALTFGDVDLQRRTITVNKALDDRAGEIKEPKTKSGFRTVPIPDNLYPHLAAKIGKGHRNPAAFLFTGDNSKKLLASSNYKRAWQSLLNKMDINLGAKCYRNKIRPETSRLDRSITPYYLRHTYCSMLAELDVDIKTAQYFMGHSSITVTADIYQHVTERMHEAGTQKIRQM